MYVTSKLDFDPSLVPPANIRGGLGHLHGREFFFANTATLSFMFCTTPMRRGVRVNSTFFAKTWNARCFKRFNHVSVILV